MDNNWAKMIATGFIWSAFTLVGVAALTRDGSLSGSTIIIVALLIGGAVAATNFVWNGNTKSAAVAADKAKRRGKIDRVLESMNERDIEALRARLMADDGEAVSLEELLAERAGRR